MATLAFTVIGAIAACAAAYFGWKSPSKVDLARVERNTGETAQHVDAVRGHVAEQSNREALARRIDRLPISVDGDAALMEPLELIFILEDPGAILLRADLINKASTLTGSVECAQQGANIFSATVEAGFVFLWFDSGEITGNLRRALMIRASFTIDGTEAYRTFPVELRRSTRYTPEPAPATDGWFLNGRC